MLSVDDWWKDKIDNIYNFGESLSWERSLKEELPRTKESKEYLRDANIGHIQTC